MSTDLSNAGNGQTAQADEADEKRRDALRKMGAFAAYTAPALIVMLGGEQAVAADSVLT